MSRHIALYLLLYFGIPGIVPAQKAAAPTPRYYRLICIVHLTGSGQVGDPILPEYVAEGTAVAQASIAVAIASTDPAAENAPASLAAGPRPEPVPSASGTKPERVPVSAAAPPIARPGFLAWSMQKTDDGKMAIVHIVAADLSAFALILKDTRPEIRAFLIGRDSKKTIEATMRRYKKDFDLDSFEVPVQFMARVGRN